MRLIGLSINGQESYADTALRLGARTLRIFISPAITHASA